MAFDWQAGRCAAPRRGPAIQRARSVEFFMHNCVAALSSYSVARNRATNVRAKFSPLNSYSKKAIRRNGRNTKDEA